MHMTGFYGWKIFPGRAAGLDNAIAAQSYIMREAHADELQKLNPRVLTFKKGEIATK